jgi:hypothetical protein
MLDARHVIPAAPVGERRLGAQVERFPHALNEHVQVVALVKVTGVDEGRLPGVVGGLRQAAPAGRPHVPDREGVQVAARLLPRVDDRRVDQADLQVGSGEVVVAAPVQRGLAQVAGSGRDRLPSLDADAARVRGVEYRRDGSRKLAL